MQIISAFETPKLRYDPIRKVFYQIQGRPSLHGTAEASQPPSTLQEDIHVQALENLSGFIWLSSNVQLPYLGTSRCSTWQALQLRTQCALQDKVQMYMDRMYLLLQRLKRNRNFSRPAFAGIKANSRDYVEVRQAQHRRLLWALAWMNKESFQFKWRNPVMPQHQRLPPDIGMVLRVSAAANTHKNIS